MSEMSDMSRAIRERIEAESRDRTIRGLSDDVLDQYVQIVGAFYLDLKDELNRREREAGA